MMLNKNLVPKVLNSLRRHVYRNCLFYFGVSKFLQVFMEHPYLRGQADKKIMQPSPFIAYFIHMNDFLSAVLVLFYVSITNIGRLLRDMKCLRVSY